MGKATKKQKTEIDDDLVRQLAALLEETGLNEIEYGKDGLTVRVAKNAGATPNNPTAAVVPAPILTAPIPAETAPVTSADHPGAITSPMVGVVHTSADPHSPPFVKIGDEVNEGQTLVLIEAMKVFNPIFAPQAGKVMRILVANGTPVEFGEPLVIIE